jgi:cell division initiation protein
MALTPADIEKKTFSTALRGYDLDEVDDFLDEVVVALREMEAQMNQARARVAELERDPDAPATAVPPPVAAVPAAGLDESAVGRALIAAQQAADRLLEDARADADRTLRESRSEAEQVLESARSEADTYNRERDLKKAEVEAEMAQMADLVAGVRTKLAVLATSVADKLDEMDAAIAADEAAEGGGPAPDEPDAGETVLDAAADEDVEPEAVDEAAETMAGEVEDEGGYDEGDVSETSHRAEGASGSIEIEGLDFGGAGDGDSDDEDSGDDDSDEDGSDEDDPEG